MFVNNINIQNQIFGTFIFNDFWLRDPLPEDKRTIPKHYRGDV